MKVLSLLVFIAFLPFYQDDPELRSFTFSGTVYDKGNGQILDSYIVEVFEGNAVFAAPEVDKKGRFEANLFANSSYIIDISHEGFYPKRVVVHTTVPEDVKKIPEFKFEIELIRKSDYEMLEEKDPLATSIFDFPYVIFEWDEAIEDFNFRESYTDYIKEKYAELDEKN